MNAHQRRVERRRLTRLGLSVPLWMRPGKWVRVISDVQLDHVSVGCTGDLTLGGWYSDSRMEFRKT